MRQEAGRVSVQARRIEPREDGEQVAVQAQVGDELLHLLAHLVGAIADLFVGMDLRPQPERLGVLDGDLRGVPHLQRSEGVREGGGLELRDQPRHLGELVMAALTDPGQPVAVAGESEWNGCGFGVVGHRASLGSRSDIRVMEYLTGAGCRARYDCSEHCTP